MYGDLLNMNRIYKKFLALIFIVAILLLPGLSMGADISSSQDSLSKLAEFSYSDHNIKFTSPSGATEISDEMEISFSVTFDLSDIVLSDINLSHGPSSGLETLESLSAVPNSTDWGASISGQKIIFSHPTDISAGNINPGDIINVKIGKNTPFGVNQIKNGPAGNYLVIISGSFGDAGQIPTVVLSSDQLYADADIIPVISLTLSTTATSFGLVDLGVVETSSPDITMTIATNHANGYNVKIFDVGDGINPGLFKSTEPIIPSPDSNYDASVNLDSVIAGYGIQAICTSGCVTDTEISSRYNQIDNVVGGLKLLPEFLIQYPTYPSSKHIVRIRHLAKVSQYTKTGVYVDKIIYQATANY